MKIAASAEQKWILAALSIALLAALPSFFMKPSGAGGGPAAEVAAIPTRHEDAVPIVESTWAPRAMSGEEQGALNEALKIDINHADAEAFNSLPGVGDATAQNIIAYREGRGCFRDIEEIRKVKGLGGPAKFNVMKDHIRVDMAGCVFKDGDVEDDAKPTKKSSRSKKSMAESSGGMVNINTASLKELDSLPGIGKTTAQRIIDHREANGPFGSIEDLMQVQGIKSGTFEKVKDLITTN